MKYARNQVRAQYGLGKINEEYYQKMEEATTLFINSGGKRNPFAGPGIGTVLLLGLCFGILWTVTIPNPTHQNLPHRTETEVRKNGFENRETLDFIQPVMSNEKRRERRLRRKTNWTQIPIDGRSSERQYYQDYRTTKL